MIGAANPYHLLLVAAALSALPLFLGAATSYVKVSVVISLLRSAFGAQQMPGNIAVMALSLALTALVMGSTFAAVISRAASLPPAAFTSEKSSVLLDQMSGLFAPWRDFLAAHSGEREVKTLQRAARDMDGVTASAGEGENERPGVRVILAAFMLTELRQAFLMGFAVLLPFLVIDIVTANILVGMGMSMVSPMMVSLPLKIILFVLADGWLLLSRGIVYSYLVSR
jgi:type III secretory pathway component EscR